MNTACGNKANTINLIFSTLAAQFQKIYNSMGVSLLYFDTNLCI